MAWARNGTPNTLSGTADDCDITDLTAYKFNQFMFHKIQVTGNASMNQTFNNNSNTVYARRGSSNGAADFTSTSGDHWNTGQDISGDEFIVQYTNSISGEEKLAIMFTVSESTSGATTAPARKEQVGKFVPSPDADITRIDFNNDQAGDYDTGTNLSALTGDETETVSLQDGTIFEETDTNKAYIWSSSSQTWTQL